ncbi:MAG: phospholipase D-like domain-containing protein [Thaumarchaeota archaeon]|nr:phospholipase D-like domain-containing protein [Nitrososphaerota archaeon]
MPERKEIVDNETDKYTMGDFLNGAIKKSPTQFDVCTGYFNVSGFSILKDNLWNAVRQKSFTMRLLFGRETISKERFVGRASIESADDKVEREDSQDQDAKESSVGTEIERLDINEQSANLVDNLINFLGLDNVLVKSNAEKFNHAKCYITDEVVAVGSSNFTAAGLGWSKDGANVELNAVLYQPSGQRPVKEWFERRWNEGTDSKQELIDLLEQSKFGAPLTPYVLYMKFLYEYYKIRLKELEAERGKILELTSFQQDALNTARRILAKFDGVLVADSTGLGKTHIGIEVLRDFALRRKKIIVIAPAQVLNTVWTPKLKDASIRTEDITMESTGTDSFEVEEYLDYDVVLIDESHNYRNASTNRRQNIMKLLAGGKKKKIILLTATPVNNSLMDLYYQVSLITAGDDAHFVELGIPDLKTHFVSADRKDLDAGIDDITRLLDEIMIRRTRQFIIDNYQGAEMEGKPVKFPTRLPPEKVEYSLTELFGGAVYRQVLDAIENLHMVPYRIDSYRLTVEEQEKFEAEHRAALQKFGLLKRFESSIEAIRKSVERLMRFYEYFDKSISSGKILTSKKFHRIIKEIEEKQELEEEENDEEIFKALESVELEPLTREFDVRQMKLDLKDDLKMLQPLQRNLEKMKPYADRKLRALEEQLLKDDAFETGGKKVVIFTQFVDTAKYLERELKANLKEREIRLLTGETDKADRIKILREFAPKANNPEKIFVRKESDLLISTDVLSEGQNLQDCNYIVNYDLPWNPMKIVQRVGRVDRLGSDFDTITSVVFIPEKELEDILGLLERLEERIHKVAMTVGTEATILGEKENPKNFNAIARISSKDPKLMDDMQRAAELLPTQTPFLSILAYLKKMGALNLDSIQLGRRSGKFCGDSNGVVIFYREKKNPEGLHLVFFDYKTGKFEPYNEMGWFWSRIECDENELLLMPLESREAYRQFKAIDTKAREEILIQLNKPFDARNALRIKPKYQRELVNVIQQAYNDGKISNQESLPIFRLLNQHNLGPWEDEFEGFLAEYKRQENIKSLLSSLEQLFQRFKVETRERPRPRPLNQSDLEIVCYVYLSNAVFKELSFPLLVGS